MRKSLSNAKKCEALATPSRGIATGKSRLITTKHLSDGDGGGAQIFLKDLLGDSCGKNARRCDAIAHAVVHCADDTVEKPETRRGALLYSYSYAEDTGG